jgi:hypothetical protein
MDAINFQKIKDRRKDMHVIGVIFNPMRYRTRIELFHLWKKHMLESGVENLHVVEVALGGRPFQITDPSNPYDMQLRTQTEMFHKEDAIMACIRKMSHTFPTWKWASWIDCDVRFVNPTLLDDTIAEHDRGFHLVQPWSFAKDLSTKHEIYNKDKGFVYCYQNNIWQKQNKYGETGVPHPGYAWSGTREFFNKVGIITFSPLGAADHQMAWCALGRPEMTMPKNVHPGFTKMLELYSSKLFELTNGHLGLVPGEVLHSHHGPKFNRKYRGRWAILDMNNGSGGYDPYTDMWFDENGLVVLTPKKPKMTQDIRKYFESRDEDDSCLTMGIS